MPASSPYPLFLDLHHRPVLIVGGGPVAFRKTRGLLASGARVTIVSPAFVPALADLPQVDRIQAPYAATHMARKPWRLVFAATDRPEVNEQVHKHAEAAGIFCCRCDKPEHGDFSSGATRLLLAEQRDEDISAGASSGVVLAVSTSAASPALAARLCNQAAAAVDPVLVKFTSLLGEWRARVKAQLPAGPERKELLQKIAGETMETILRTHGESAAHEQFRQWLAQAAHAPHTAASPPDEPLTEGPSPTGHARHADQ